MNSKKNKLKKRLLITLGIFISALFLYLTFNKVDMNATIEALKNVNIKILSLSIITMFLGLVFMAKRTMVLASGVAKAPYFTFLKSIFVSYVGNCVLPLRIGEFARMDYLARKTSLPHSTCLAMIVVERLLDMCCLFIVVAILLFVTFLKFDKGIFLFVLAFFVFAGIAFIFTAARYPVQVEKLFVLLVKPLGKKIGGFLLEKTSLFINGLSGLSSLSVVLKLIFLSIAYWAAAILTARIWILAFGFDFDFPLIASAMVLAWVSFGTLLPSSPGFIGTYHLAAATALILLGQDKSSATAFAILAHAMATIPLTFLGISLLFKDYFTKSLFNKKE